MSASQTCCLILTVTLFSVLRTASYASGSHLRPTTPETQPLQQADYAVDLKGSNFDAVLGDAPASYAIVEFFAHWSPACRSYKPRFEKVARIFNGPDAVHPGIILMARVDCALKENMKLCDKFSVVRYPILFWGPRSKFVSGGWNPKEEKSEIHVIDDGRTAERMLNWINEQLCSSYGLDDEKKDPNLLNLETLPVGKRIFHQLYQTLHRFSLGVSTNWLRNFKGYARLNRQG